MNKSILANKLSRQIGWLSEYGLDAEDFTIKIGDCLFDNVVAQLPSGSPSSQQLRQNVVRFLSEHSDEYAEKMNYDERLLVGEGIDSVHFETWEHYLEGMNRPQVWATELEINALSTLLDCPFILLALGAKPKIYNPEGKNAPIFLHHVRGNHFEACTPFKGLKTQDVYNAIKNKDHY
jgi:hypothetical protein